ncbi:hypothetical protein ACTXT7_013646 [Hymenolepis weldensis]
MEAFMRKLETKPQAHLERRIQHSSRAEQRHSTLDPSWRESRFLSPPPFPSFVARLNQCGWPFHSLDLNK